MKLKHSGMQRWIIATYRQVLTHRFDVLLVRSITWSWAETEAAKGSSFYVSSVMHFLSLTRIRAFCTVTISMRFSSFCWGRSSPLLDLKIDSSFCITGKPTLCHVCKVVTSLTVIVISIAVLDRASWLRTWRSCSITPMVRPNLALFLSWINITWYT